MHGLMHTAGSGLVLVFYGPVWISGKAIPVSTPAVIDNTSLSVCLKFCMSKIMASQAAFVYHTHMLMQSAMQQKKQQGYLEIVA